MSPAHDQVGADPAPWTGHAVIRAASDARPASTSEWTLHLVSDHEGRLHSPDLFGLDIDPQRVDATTYTRVLDLLGPPEPLDADRLPPRPIALHAGEPTPAPPVSDAPPIRAEDELDPELNAEGPPPMRVLASRQRRQRRGLDPSPIYEALLADIVCASSSASALDVSGTERASRAVDVPRVLLLGSVRVLGADDGAAPHRRRRLTELVAYLALHPEGSGHALDEALWPGARVSLGTRNATVTRARRWLGNAPTGEPYLPRYADTGSYRLHPAITTDWHDFVALSGRGLAAGPEGIDDLTAALALVRGRPFHGIDPRDYAWAERDIQDMINLIDEVTADPCQPASAST